MPAFRCSRWRSLVHTYVHYDSVVTREGHETHSAKVPADLPDEVAGNRIIGILRGCPPLYAVPIARAAFDAGIHALEVTLDSENALDQISAIRAALPMASVGVGSVLTAEEASTAIAHGAEFVVSPIVDRATIESCVEVGIPSIPGAATPTEINQARLLGASAIKVFPIQLLGGIDYLQSIMSPLRSPDLIPTGGVTYRNLAEYLAKGAVAVGVGSSVFSGTALAGGDADLVHRLASAAVEACR